METYFGFSDLPLADSGLFAQGVFLTIGNFDGVHRGHQALVAAMAEAGHAAGCRAGLLTFDPHPLAVLRPDLPLVSLTSIAERGALLEALGLDFMLVLPFSRQTAGLSAGEFMAQIARHMTLRQLWVGPDFALGRGREGDAVRLAEIGAQLGYTVRVVEPFHWQGQPVRSSRIRSLLAEAGNATEAADLLSRPYYLRGQVAEGNRRGRRLGFPTANVVPPPDRLVPANGVYACWAWREDRGHPAVVNVGIRPTFDDPQRAARSIEAYLFDFEGDLYGEELGLSFVARLRGEERFPDAAALIAQIEADVAAGRRILADPTDHAAADRTEAGPFWQELRHTADWAIRVTAPSQRQLFARAAAAMYLLQDADPARPITLARIVRAQADRPADLLVSWLNRLLLAQEVAGEMYTRFEIHAISERGVLGVAYGYEGAPSHTAVKAVTYHDLVVERTADGWTAQVTFDV